MLEKMKSLTKQGLLAVLLVTLVVANFPLPIQTVAAADTTPPVVTINTPGNSSIFELGVDITYTYSVVETYPTTEEVLLNSNPISDTGTISGLGTGMYNLTVVSTDNSSNVGWDQIIFFVSDTVAPAVSITTPTNATIFELGTEVTYSYTENDLSSTSVVVRRNGIIVSDTGLFIGLPVGTYTLNIEATDAHNNVGVDEITFFVEDSTSPVVTITSPANASTYEFGGNVAYTYSVTDLSGVTATILLDGGVVPDTGLLTNPEIGTHNLTIQVTDDYNNVASDQITFFVQDTFSPVVTITSPVNNTIYELGTDVAYSYTVDDQSATSVVVKLDGVPISDTGLLTSLSVGTYTLRVEADDGLNLIGFNEIIFSVADTTAPVVSITSPVNDTYFELGSAVVYGYTTNDLSGLSVVVKLNGSPIPDSGTIAGLLAGTYTLRVEATDAYSNFGFDEVIFFVEDSVSPVVTIDSPVNASSFEFGSDVTYSYTITDLSGTTIVVKLDGVPITDSGLISGLAVGTYTLTVEATDTYNNVGSDEIVFTIQDTISPVVSITSPTNASTFEFGSDVSYTYSVDDLSGTSVVVKLDGAPIADSGLITGLSVGTYTLTIEATDSFSNFGFDEIVFDVIDSTSPTVTITTPTNASIFEFGSDVSYTYTVSDLSGTSVVVKISGAPIADSGSVSGLGVGTYTLTIEATDSFSNIGVDDIVFFVQDTTLPVVVITSPANASTFEFGSDVSYTYTVTDLSSTTVVVRLDSAPIADTGLISGLSVGTYTLTVEATDAYGNVGVAETVFFYLVDTVPPVVTITSPANASTFEFGSDVSYTYTVSDLSGTTIVVKLDGVPIVDSGTISGLLVGTYALTVEATDSSNNVGSDEIVFIIQDTTAPVVTITTPTNSSSFEFGSDVSYTYTVSDLSGTSVVVKINSAPIADIGLISGLAVGTYTLTVEATDTYSNLGVNEITFFIQDTTLPVVVITSPANASTFEFGTDVSYTYTVSDLSSTSVVVKLDGAPITDTGLISGL
ncbi:MAG: beta strand repeat-containing protein, partial [Candidatus Hodarchaeales archaeon]